MNDAPEDEIHLPKGIQVIADVIGVEAALQLTDRFGGLMNVYIPEIADKKHAWAQVIGFPAWKKMCAAFGKRRISLPRGCFIGLKKYAIIQLAEQGVPKRQIALRCRVAERYVYEVLQGLTLPTAANKSQLKLFD